MSAVAVAVTTTVIGAAAGGIGIGVQARRYNETDAKPRVLDAGNAEFVIPMRNLNVVNAWKRIARREEDLLERRILVAGDRSAGKSSFLHNLLAYADRNTEDQLIGTRTPGSAFNRTEAEKARQKAEEETQIIRPLPMGQYSNIRFVDCPGFGTKVNNQTKAVEIRKLARGWHKVAAEPVYNGKYSVFSGPDYLDEPTACHAIIYVFQVPIKEDDQEVKRIKELMALAVESTATAVGSIPIIWIGTHADRALWQNVKFDLTHQDGWEYCRKALERVFGSNAVLPLGCWSASSRASEDMEDDERGTAQQQASREGSMSGAEFYLKVLERAVELSGK